MDDCHPRAGLDHRHFDLSTFHTLGETMKGTPHLNQLVIDGYSAALQGKPREAPTRRYPDHLAWELGWRQGRDQSARYAVVRMYLAHVRRDQK